MTNPFRILSIDGGGVRGTFPAAYLTYVEQSTGKRMADHFDLMVGTSTGGIVALALSLGIPAANILELYEQHSPRIFPRTGGLWRTLRWIAGPKYSNTPLTAALAAAFGTRQLGEAICRVCIPSFNATVNDIWIYKTAHHAKYRHDYRVQVIDIARATSAAPTYLPPWQGESGALHVDGGVWANNPAVVALTEAAGPLGVPLDQIRMLSLGTTTMPHDWSSQVRPGGIGSWGRNGAVVQLLMHGQEVAAQNQASLLLGDRYLRVNPTVPAGRFGLDRSDTAGELRAFGEREARHTLDRVSTMFLTEPADPFIPVYALEHPAPQAGD